MAPALQHVVGVVQSSIDIQQDVKQLRSEQDTVKTKLSAVNSELELISKHQLQVSQQLKAAEQQAKQRFQSLREDLEMKLANELTAMRGQLDAQRQHDYDREVKLFEERQQDVIGKALDQELEMKSKELDQLSQEIDVQTQELVDRLGKLEGSPDIAKTLERSTREVLAKRRNELDERRRRLSAERAAQLDKQRGEFAQQLNQQLDADNSRRLKVKEASLRSSMAELLKKAERDEAGKVERLRQASEEAGQRYSRALQQQALLSTRAEVIAKDLASNSKTLEKLDTERQTAVRSFEEQFAPMLLEPEALDWLGRSIRYMPPAVAAELMPLQQRLVASAEQEQRLRQQKRLVYERQMAVQLSREMEEKRREVELAQQREQAVRFKRAKDMIDEADGLAKKGQFDAAIDLLSQAQAINPPQLSQIAMSREQFLAARQQQARASQTAQVERLFNQAMNSFQSGQYEEAVALFEQVISQEAKAKDSLTMVGGSAR